MSTHYAPRSEIRAVELLDGRLEKLGVRERPGTIGSESNRRCLTDGRNCLWVNIDEAGFVTFVRYLPNGSPMKILNAIAEAFGTEIVSEHQPQYWGFETQEEWDAYQHKIARKHEEQFYLELLKHLRGETCDIRPGTIGMAMAQIGEKLVAEDPALMLPLNKEKLLDAIESIYNRDHVMTVSLSPQELALARMIGTDEDDLPSA